MQAADDRAQESPSAPAGAGRAASLGPFAACLAHEVNQPIAAIMANGEAALRWLDRPVPDVQEARAALARLVRDAERAAAVVARMRAMTADSRGQRQPTDVRRLIEESLQFTAFQLRRAQVRAEVSVPDGLPCVDADPVQVQQVLVNLIANAIDAMKTVGGRRRMLRAWAEAGADGMVVVSVSDTGAGVDAASAERVFDHLFTTKPDGMGLGLSICKSIVEAHGGRIRTGANTPFGAVFSFTLPPAAPAAD